MAISDDLNSIRTHLEDDYTALETLGVSVEDRNIENIKDMANQIYAKFPKTSYAEGSNITLSNTLKGKLDFEDEDGKKKMGYGQTEQKSYEGYNILPLNSSILRTANTTGTWVNDYTYTHNGITYTIDYNTNKIKANGTASGVAIIGIPILLMQGNTYRISGCPIGGGDNNYRAYIIDTQSYSQSINDNGSGAVLTSANYTNYQYRCRIANGYTANNILFEPMIIEGSTAKDFEPFVGNSPSPSPSYPQDIEVVRGKNIWHFNNNNFVSNSNTTSNIINENKLEVTSTNTTYANTKFLLSEKGNNIYIPDGQYTFSIGKVTNTNSSMTRQMITLSTYTNGVRAVIDNIIVGTPKTITITNAPNKRYILEFWGSYDTALINTATFEEIQIEKGSQATSYLPYNTLEVVERGKNLFEPVLYNNETQIAISNISSASVTDGEFSFTANGSDMYFGNIVATGGSYANDRGIKIYRNGKEKISFKCTSNNFSKNYICAFNSNGVSLGYSSTLSYEGTYTFPENCDYVTFRLGKGDAVSGTTYKTKVILAYGDEIPTYEPYQTPTTHQLSLGDKELYTDSKIVRVSKNNFKFVDKFEKVRITGTPSTINTSSTNTTRVSYTRGMNNNCILSNRAKCNRLKYATIWSTDEEGFYNDNNSRLVIMRMNKSVIGETNESVSAYLEANETYILGELVTPIETPITDTTLINQLENFYNSHSFTGTTIIEIDGQLPLIIKVRALKGE